MFIDIACNITCEGFKNNTDQIMKDCLDNNVMPLFVGLDYESSVECIALSEKYNTCCYIGIHPNHIYNKITCDKDNEMTCDNDNIYNFINNQILDLDYNNPRVIAVGECGLDYFRSTQKDLQISIFKSHLSLSTDLPYFYHCRNAHSDFLKLANRFGVVHSFDGTLEEAESILKRGFYIGINGCSLKTNENLNVVKEIPIDRILIETDSPFCMVRKSYAGSNYLNLISKGKINTPVNVIQIAEILSKIKGISMGELEGILLENTLRVFPKLKEFISQWK